MLPQLGRMAGSASQVLDALFENSIVNIGRIVEKTGQKRNRLYAYTAYLEILNQE